MDEGPQLRGIGAKCANAKHADALVIERQVSTLLTDMMARLNALRARVSFWRLEFFQVGKIRRITELRVENVFGMAFLSLKKI